MKSRKIIWAVNPSQMHPNILKNTSELLKLLSAKGGWTVEPVFAATHSHPDGGYSRGKTVKNASTLRATKAFDKALSGKSIPNLLSLRVLEAPGFSPSRRAEALADYAAEEKTECIVVGATGKHRLSRWVLGSFAEALLYRARNPVILVKKFPRVGYRSPRTLFASDFTPSSLAAFRKFCGLLFRLKARVTVFHAIPGFFQVGPPGADIISASLNHLSSPMPENEYLRKVRAWCNRRAKSYLDVAKKRNIQVKFQMAITDASVHRTILKFAERHKIKILALTGKSGRWTSLFWGSTAKHLARADSCPVWIYRPK